GYAVGSLALIADSFHMLNDVMSLIVALYAIKLTNQSATDSRYSYGWHRAEILAALINGVFLLALCFSIGLEATERFFSRRREDAQLGASTRSRTSPRGRPPPRRSWRLTVPHARNALAHRRRHRIRRSPTPILAAAHSHTCLLASPAPAARSFSACGTSTVLSPAKSSACRLNITQARCALLLRRCPFSSALSLDHDASCRFFAIHMSTLHPPLSQSRFQFQFNERR
ncbi:cation efflux family-domain-containing protein, partial [Mycena olivaceomarginata]